jgi:hypothetical protein
MISEASCQMPHLRGKQGKREAGSRPGEKNPTIFGKIEAKHFLPRFLTVFTPQNLIVFPLHGS